MEQHSKEWYLHLICIEIYSGSLIAIIWYSQYCCLLLMLYIRKFLLELLLWYRL
uniref:Uncharacterized protein n=1 Tax=Arundo donax TaxID=35708 RepID=A0A0A9AA92_ARUDO